MPDYLIPANTVTIEQYIKKSQFICHLRHTENRQQAMEFIATIKGEYNDANHNCWAFVAGEPEDPSCWGMNDDGEPKGCAGKPMFQVLHHHGAGEICAVVTRYFGGIKLGTGGMARGYSSTVKLALDEMEFKKKIIYVRFELAVPYSLQKSVVHFVDSCEGVIIETTYGADIFVAIDIPLQQRDQFLQLVTDAGRGAIAVKKDD